MQKFELFDETFDPFRTESYELSIQVSLNGFSFCVKDIARELFIVLGSVPFEQGLCSPDDWALRGKEIFTKYNWISRPFKKVRLSHVNPVFTLVPKDYFEPEKAKQILALTHPIPSLDEIRYHNIHAGVLSIFSVPSILVTTWLTAHKNTEIISCFDPIIKYQLISTKGTTTHSLWIGLLDGYTSITLTKGGNLLHSGSIETRSNEDTVYYMVNICKQFDCPTTDTSVHILGENDILAEFLHLINRFFKKALPLVVEDKFHYSYQLASHKEQFANLFSHSLCE